MTKDALCEGCALYTCPGPVMGEFATPDVKTYHTLQDDEELVDVMFVGEALGATEVAMHRPMIGEAGKVLRETIKQCNYERVGITNVWKVQTTAEYFT